MEVCRGECNLVISSGVRRKGRSSTEGEGVWILNSIAHPPSYTDYESEEMIVAVNAIYAIA